MTDWAGLTHNLENLLKLNCYPVAFKWLQKAAELEKIPKVRRLARKTFICQAATLVRRGGMTIALTKNDVVGGGRCSRLLGLATTTTEEIAWEENNLVNTWFSTVEDVKKQHAALPSISPGEAIILSPLASGKFEPDVILIYGNPAQLMMLMCGLQNKDYQRLNFNFSGESSCVDGIAQCYNSGKPALCFPCFGERRYSGVADDELYIVIPAGMMQKAVEGVQTLWNRGLRYPILPFSAECDPSAGLKKSYPDLPS